MCTLTIRLPDDKHERLARKLDRHQQVDGRVATVALADYERGSDSKRAPNAATRSARWPCPTSSIGRADCEIDADRPYLRHWTIQAQFIVRVTTSRARPAT